MRGNREKLIRLMRTLNRINGQYDRFRRTLEVKESLFVLLYVCADGVPRSQKEICDEWHIPRSTLNTTVMQQVDAGNVMLVPRGDKQKDVCLTEQGEELAELTLGTLLDAEDQIALRCVGNDLVAGLEALADEMEGAIGGARRKKA